MKNICTYYRGSNTLGEVTGKKKFPTSWAGADIRVEMAYTSSTHGQGRNM